MSRRSWLNPPGPTGKPLGLVNPINEPETGNEIWIHKMPLPATTIPTLSPSDVAKFMKSYKNWAPAPYNNSRIPGDGAMTRFCMLFTGYDIEAMFSGSPFPEAAKIDFELEICRQRLWAGMVPLSDRRWAEKKLDMPENIDLAAEYLLKTCDMVHFSLPEISDNARRTYNKIYDALVHFDTVLDAYYTITLNTSRPTPAPRLADL
ncbi:hypothetical protein N0V88_008107 [Collariella sp. IMI 366227]|nr:hypothetical protein N0V88_008107 [Collariella sp. IMI 366227]